MFDKKSLHHAYFIEGDKEAVISDIYVFLEKELNIKKEGHPDIHYSHHQSFGIEESRALGDMQTMKPIMGDMKIFIVSLDSMTSEAQNSLLKIFEEPTPGTHFFIISSSERILLPTLRSRLRVISHHSVNKNKVLAEAKNFIGMSPAKRLEFVSSMIEEKDKTKAEEFMEAVIAEVRREKGTKNKAPAIKEMINMTKYLKDRAPSVKLILERLSLLDL